MITLNTIIEEEKTKGQEYLDSAINNREKALYLEDVLDTVITSAMQRAYEAGQSEERAKIREALRKGGISSDCIYQDEIDGILAMLTPDKQTEV